MHSSVSQAHVTSVGRGGEREKERDEYVHIGVGGGGGDEGVVQ